MSLWRNIHLAKCPFGEVSLQRNGFGEMSFGEMAFGEMSDTALVHMIE
jgi:hypothetical protein